MLITNSYKIKITLNIAINCMVQFRRTKNFNIFVFVWCTSRKRRLRLVTMLYTCIEPVQFHFRYIRCCISIKHSLSRTLISSGPACLSHLAAPRATKFARLYFFPRPRIYSLIFLRNFAFEVRTIYAEERSVGEVNDRMQHLDS